MNTGAEAVEYISRKELEQIQLERLQATLTRAYKNVPAYTKCLDDAGFPPEALTSLEDLGKLPFTTDRDLATNYPYNMFAVPLREIVRVHSTVSNAGKPMVVGYTKNDLRVWAELVARNLMAASITKDDIIQIVFGQGMFVGAFGFQHGAELLGATVIPVVMGDIEKQIMIMKDYRSTVLVGLPSYAWQIAGVIKDMRMNPQELNLRCGIFGAEPWSENLRGHLENGLNLKAYDSYSVTEVAGPGIAGECEYHDGLHVWEDHFIVEIIDPKTGQVLPDGHQGELVLTTLTKEAFPVIRYRTGDVTSLTRETCKCGRTMARIGRISGRSDDLIIVSGVKIFPSQIENILRNFEGIEPNFQLIVPPAGSTDEAELWIEMKENLFSDDYKQLQSLTRSIRDELHRRTGLEVKIRPVEPGQIAKNFGQQRRVLDYRT